jgi:hypothetical protein
LLAITAPPPSIAPLAIIPILVAGVSPLALAILAPPFKSAATAAPAPAPVPRLVNPLATTSGILIIESFIVRLLFTSPVVSFILGLVGVLFPGPYGPIAQ